VLRRLARRSLPQVEGTLRLACLDEPVEVVRDRYGIPHVYACSRRDLVRAQGYVHAQDRLFQMEGIRRFAWGRLSELAGPQTLELDRAARRLRLRWAAERELAACDPEAAALLEAYCEGVNAFLARGPRPFELRLARVRPEPWTPVDAHAPGAMLAMSLSGNWETELMRTRLRARLPEERVARLTASYPDDHPLIVDGELAREGLFLTRALRRLVAGLGGSNAFAVSGARTDSGLPLLANDPHLLLSIPGIWHAQHLVWEGGETWGFTVPGAPVVVLGRNRCVAWGLTTAMVDTQDLYVERFDREGRYEADGEWLEPEVVREEIRVRRRREPVVEKIAVTRHGPVVVPPEPGGGEAFALRWSHHESGETLRSLLDLMDARSVAEADRALDRFAGPPHSFVLADTEGSIAFRLAGGPIPRRTGDGRDPVPGWNSAHEWGGYVAQKELPRTHDPASGLVVSANNRITAGIEIPGEYLSGYRAARLEALVRERERLTAADCERIMLDTFCAPGLELAGLVAGLETGDPLERRALDLLRDWDGDLGVESPAGAVYGALLEALERACYADAADPDVPISIIERSRPALLRAVAERDDGFLPEGRTWDEVLPGALAEAVRKLGPDPERWRRGERHRLELRHALDGVRGLKGLLSRGPFPVGGDADTVRVFARAKAAGPNAMIGASMRAVYDLADADATRIALCPGQSGHPASPHYDDLLEGWLAGEYVPFATARTHVDELAEACLILTPE
jgi:penicillin G amidase